MAKSLGKKSGNILVWILMVLLVVGLGGFGVGNFGGAVQTIGKVGDQDITTGAYGRELQQEMRAIEAQTGQSMTLSQAQQFGIDQAVIQRLVSNAALDDEARTIGVSVGDEKVREQVLAIPAFRNLDGSFDRDAYRQSLSRAGMTEPEFEAGIRSDTTRSLMQGAVAGGIVPADTYINTLLSYVGERRSFTWARFDDSTLPEPIAAPTQHQLTAYYTANAPQFTLPESKRITYVWLAPEMILDSTPVDEDALRALYTERRDEYQRPERRLIERLVFPTEEDATAAKARLDDGTADFDALVAERGLKIDDIDLGDLAQGDLGAAGDAIFALTEPGVVGPLPSSVGPALFRMNGILAAQNTSFEQARPDLVEEYAIDAARRRIDGEIETIDNLLVGGATLEDVAKETDMQVGTIDWYDAMKDGIAAYDTFAVAAANLTGDDYPVVTRLDDGGIFAMRLDDTIPPALQPMDKVRDAVVAGWQTQETETRLDALVTTLIPQIKDGADIAGFGVTATVETVMTRDAFVEGTPADFMVQVFDMAQGEVRSLKGDGAVFVVKLDAVMPVDPANPDMEGVKTALTTQSAQGIAQDTFEFFSRALTAEAGITLDQAAINAVHAQFP
ncbi:SurA N-terminal domain-containing protein [Pseudogemmobacter sp. W21_MBD1_M6]|uniref:SurA N-terminal domain-containing protein n=1 Tax=Pseudogemmobacter sp. W21_MBD1_M6 TaxID=3240271 RepID=UPI003F9C5F82